LLVQPALQVTKRPSNRGFGDQSRSNFVGDHDYICLRRHRDEQLNFFRSRCLHNSFSVVPMLPAYVTKPKRQAIEQNKVKIGATRFDDLCNG